MNEIEEEKMKPDLSFVGLLLIFVSAVYCSLNFDDVFQRFSVQDYFVYNDSKLIALLTSYKPSKVFYYINDNIYLNHHHYEIIIEKTFEKYNGKYS